MRLRLAPPTLTCGALHALLWFSPAADGPSLPLAIGVGVLVLVACGVAVRQMSRRATEDREPTASDLEAQGLLVSTEFRADRAFAVEEYGDEGSHYFLELEDGSVLYLTGKYLHPYEPLDEDAELADQRRFPCTEFTVRRHRETGAVVDILCRGEVLQPEMVGRPYEPDDLLRSDVPADGEIIRHLTYDQLKAEREGPRRRG